MNRISQFISVLFHPMFMPLYATVLLLNSGSYLGDILPSGLKQFLYAIVFVTTWLLPASITWLLWQKGWIDSPEMSDRSERHIPFLLTMICYSGGIYLLLQLPVSRLFALSLTGGALAVLMAFLVNLRWKISIHMIGIGGLMGLFFGYGAWFHLEVMTVLAFMAVAAGLVGTARLIRGAHSAAQVYAGFLSGFLIEAGFIRVIAQGLLTD
jgi:hypothetical protein